MLGCATTDLHTNFIGTTRYARANLMVESGRLSSANWRSGRVLPVGTQVRIVKATARSVRFLVGEWAEEVAFEVDYQTEKEILGAFDECFSLDDPRPHLTELAVEEQVQVKNATVAPGMSRYAVLLAIGRPPRHSTPVLFAPKWCYIGDAGEWFAVWFDGQGRVLSVGKAPEGACE
jgi:hypothetical protein